MGLNSEGAFRSAVVFDIECAAIDGAADYLEPVSAPSNYSKPDAIQKYIDKATAEQLEKCALDVDLARIIAIGVLAEGETDPTIRLCQTEAEERAALVWFWSFIGPYPFPRLVGFNVCGYDLPMLMRRSLYLGVTAPTIQVGRYKHPGIDDLMLTLSFDGALKFRGLHFFCKRFGISVPDELTGADIAQAVTDGRWSSIAAHCQADIQMTAALAAKLGLFRLTEVAHASF